jgi:hypothetical protein
MPKLRLLDFQLSCFHQNLLPQLDLHLSGRHLCPSLFSTQWYLTLFQHEFAQDFSLAFLFLFGLSDEPGRLMLQVTIQILGDYQTQIVQTRDPEECIGIIKD